MSVSDVQDLENHAFALASVYFVIFVPSFLGAKRSIPSMLPVG